MSYEQGPIRPPSEAESLFVRVTRNCPWNKCLFCPAYKRKKFSRRPVDEIKADILEMKKEVDKVKSYLSKFNGADGFPREALELIYRQEPELLQIALWLFRGGKNVFLQDGDNLNMPAEKLAEVLTFLREQFPTVERITTYARSKTACRRSVSELKMLKDAGLTRVHIGLESGHDPLLKYMDKGVTAEEHVEGGLKIKEAGLSLSEYVLLGLGGRAMWKGHALDTAKVLSRIDPHYIRIRTLAIREGIPLYEQYQAGEFEPLDDDGLALEEKLLFENLSGSSYVVSDHMLNLLEEVQGSLAHDKPFMLGVMDSYLSMTEEKRANFSLGRRMGIYRYLRDMNDMGLFNQVEGVRKRLRDEGKDIAQFLTEYKGRYV
ncbi:MAG: radical SAM protein [Bacillota bacterium]|nr:radical SAM protein [Bacillota bacterium]